MAIGKLGGRGGFGHLGGLQGAGGSTDPGIVLPKDINGNGPLFVISSKKIAGYSGKYASIRRASDSAVMDLGFDAAGNLDMAAALAWAAGSAITIPTTLYDQSGFGNNSSPVGNVAVLRAANASRGKQPMTTFNGGGYRIPNAVATNRQSFAQYSVVTLTGMTTSNFGIHGLGSDASFSNDFSMVLSGNTPAQITGLGGSYGFTVVGNARSGQPSIIGNMVDGANHILRNNGVVNSTSLPTPNIALAGGMFSQNPGINYPGYFDYYFHAVWGAALSPASASALEATLAAAFDISNVTSVPTKRVVFPGDSITSNVMSAIYQLGYARQVVPLITNRGVEYINTAVFGQTMQQRYTARASDAALRDATKTFNVLHEMEGTNDLEGRASGTIVGYGTTVFNSYFVPYMQAMTTAGYNALFAGTMLARVWTGSAQDKTDKDAERIVYNNLIVANAATYGYTVVDYAGISGMTFYDGIHPDEAGMAKMAALLAPFLNAVL